MRKNDLIEEKAIHIIKGIFLDNNLKNYLSENDKTEFIDGCVFIENNIKNFNIDIGKIEIQVKGRTSGKTVLVKKSFIEYCRSNMVPVMIFLVKFDNNTMLQKIYCKYIDKFFEVDNIEQPKISFNDNDIVTSEGIQSKLTDASNRHWNSIVMSINKMHRRDINMEMYAFMNNVIRGVNGFIYTIFNRYMERYYGNISRFAVIYSGDEESGISYSIIPILKGTISDDIINIDKNISILAWNAGPIYSQGIKLDQLHVNQLIINMLKEVVVPAIINEDTFSKLNSSMAKRNIIYTFTRVLDKVKRRQNEYNSKYSNSINQIINSSKNKFSKTELMLITNANIELINEKHNKDLKEIEERINLEKNYSIQLEYDDSKINVVAKDGKKSMKIVKKSRFIYLGELLKLIDDKDIIDLDEHLNIDAFFRKGDFKEKVEYVKLKYDCICEFFSKYTNLPPRKYLWGIEKEDSDETQEYVRGGVEYSRVLANGKWESVLDESLNQKSWQQLMFQDKNYLSLRQAEFPCSRKMNFDFEPLVLDINEEFNSIIDVFIDSCFKK
jgi:hypothetical protein